MNPFDWPGPAFLLFYAVLAIVVHFVVRALYRRGPDDITALAQARSLLDDPYRLACLRAGPSEAICVALFSLLDRGLLRYDGSTVRARDDAAIGFSRRPIEQAVLKATAKPREPKELIEADGPVAAAKSYEAELTRNGLIADARVRVDRRGALYVALGVLLGVAVLKILVALIRGKSNLAFLLILAAVFTVLLLFAYASRLTGLGVRTLSDQRVLFGGLKERARALKPGGEASDAVWLVAMFGLGALPAQLFPDVRKIFPRAAQSGSDSSSGSSCGSGCSSGCGGGGGGCGGCGGD